MSADWIALLVYFGIGALMLDAEGWANVLCLSGLILVIGGLCWMMA